MMTLSRSSSRITAILILSIAIYSSWLWERAYTPPAPLSELFAITLGRFLHDQLHFVTIRSQIDAGNAWLENEDDDAPKTPSPPILLIMHGGPGASALPSIHRTNNLLEEHFIVVNYDQRSAGKSCRYHTFSSPDSNSTLTIEQHVKDALQLIGYLRGRFRVDKIYLLGGSWGSKLAMLLARDYPHLFHHVAVRGLAANTRESERLSLAFVRTKFPGFTVNGPPYGNRVKDLTRQRHYLYRAGGINAQCLHKKCSKYSLTLATALEVLRSPELSWGDVFRFRKCYLTTLERMWSEVESFSLAKEVRKLDVPLLVLHGRHDRCTCASLVEDYVNYLEAPKKKVVWFENSAHSPHVEEAMKFQQTIIKEFLDDD